MTKKPTITELESSQQFVLTLSQSLGEQWPRVRARLVREMSMLGKSNAQVRAESPPSSFSRSAATAHVDLARLDQLDRVSAPSEFLSAVLAQQMQALPNLLPASQAERVHRHILDVLHVCDNTDSLVSAVHEYECAITQALDEAVVHGGPSWIVFRWVELLYERLGLREVFAFKGLLFAPESTTMLLTEEVMNLGGAWWKDHLARYTIVA